MAKHVLNKTTHTTWMIDETGDTWILGEKGRITAAGIPGIYADAPIGFAKVEIDGRIDLAPQSFGLYLQAQTIRVNIGETGRISASDYAVVYSNNTGSFFIRNSGVLEGFWGIAAYTAQDSADIRNSGHIHGDFYGIAAGGAGALIVNSGTVKAQAGIFTQNLPSDLDDPLDADNATHIVNCGKVTGSDYSVGATGVAISLRNSGTLNGDVSLDAGEDVINNRGGAIRGDVRLGAGDDVIKAAGTLTGVIHGGLGDDVVTLASPATLYVELANEGTDTVRISATYRLGANVENLTLLGKASHTGIGNRLDNSITGNKGDNALYGLDGVDTLDGGKGNDLLTGGGDTDMFVFKPGCGRDTITDFEDGVDCIDLIAFGINGISSIDDLAISQPGDDAVIRIGDRDVLILRHVDAGSIDAGDFLFAT